MYPPTTHPLTSTLSRPLSLALVALLALSAVLVAGPLALPAPVAPASPALAPDFGKLPLSFVPNAGQSDPAVRFQVHTPGGALFFTPGELVLSLPAPSPGKSLETTNPPREPLPHPQSEIRNPKSEIRNPQSPISNPRPSCVSILRTPTPPRRLWA